MKKIGRMNVIVVVFVFLLLLTGCGNQEKVVNMKEYASPDGTYSIEADESYAATDMGVDNWLGLESSEGLDSVAVMQFPKEGGFLGGWSSLGEVIEFVEESNGLSDKEEMSKPENAEFSNIEAYTYKMTQNGYTAEISAVYGETDYAHYLLMYSESKLKSHSKDYFEKVCASFKENADAIGKDTKDTNDIEEDTDTYAIGEDPTSVAEVPDTLRWFNASNSMLIYVNGWDYQLYGGLEPDETSQETAMQILDNSWGVTDKDSADETLYWLLSEGHRTEFVEEMEFLVECGIAEEEREERASFLYENFEISEEEAQIYANWYNRYEESGEEAVSGWDYNRALSQLANFYLAGYYTLEEALDASLNVAEIIQGSFDSWDDYMESYFTGYEYWSDEGSEERRGVYEELQSAADNPFSVDFKTTLEKSW